MQWLKDRIFVRDIHKSEGKSVSRETSPYPGMSPVKQKDFCQQVTFSSQVPLYFDKKLYQSTDIPSRNPWRVVVAVTASILGAALIIAIIGGYLFNWDWTGINASSIRWTVNPSNGTTSIAVNEQQPSKTLWDWLQLFGILAIPVVVAWFTADQAAQQEANRDRRHQTDIEIAMNAQQEAVLQEYLREYLREYLHSVSDHLANDLLDLSPQGIEARTVMRVQTIAALQELDLVRKAILLHVLYKSGLIQGEHPLIGMDKADLSQIVLNGADLRGINLAGADMCEARLHEAWLNGADLNEADLKKADLSRAHLVEANLHAADLSHADLRGANLIGADLRSADLTDADLSNADLSGALLQGARYTHDQLQQVRS